MNRATPLLLVRVIVLVLCNEDLHRSFLVATGGCEHLDILEFFAGKCVITDHCRALGLTSLPYEIMLGPVLNNILSAKGFAFALYLACRLKEGSMCWLAPVCSSWVWLCQGSSGRNPAQPMGDANKVFVRQANIMVSRVVLLLHVLRARRVFWILEQPQNSLLQFHVRFQDFIRDYTVYRAHVPLGVFGSDTRKPVWLYSGHDIVNTFNQFRLLPGTKFSKSLVTRTLDGKVHGSVHLRSSQAYPEDFGREVARLFMEHREMLGVEASMLTPSDQAPVTIGDICSAVIDGDSVWDDANMLGLLGHLLRRPSVVDL
jgi:hypothetical protein